MRPLHERRQVLVVPEDALPKGWPQGWRFPAPPWPPGWPRTEPELPELRPYFNGNSITVICADKFGQDTDAWVGEMVEIVPFGGTVKVFMDQPATEKVLSPIREIAPGKWGVALHLEPQDGTTDLCVSLMGVENFRVITVGVQ